MKNQARRPSSRNVGFRNLVFTSVLACFTTCVYGCIVPDDKEPVDVEGRDALRVETRDVVEPGPQHKRLQALIGDWKAVTKSWHQPDAPVEEGKGTMSTFWLLDGRFIGQEYKSRGQRPKYQGLGALGYDNVRKMYTSVWLDTMSTGIFTATGPCDESGKVFTLEGISQDPVSGKPVQNKSVTRIIDRNKYTFELFKEDADRRMFRTLEIIYTRK